MDQSFRQSWKGSFRQRKLEQSGATLGALSVANVVTEADKRAHVGKEQEEGGATAVPRKLQSQALRPRPGSCRAGEAHGKSGWFVVEHSSGGALGARGGRVKNGFLAWVASLFGAGNGKKRRLVVAVGSFLLRYDSDKASAVPCAPPMYLGDITVRVEEPGRAAAAAPVPSCSTAETVNAITRANMPISIVVASQEQTLRMYLQEGGAAEAAEWSSLLIRLREKAIREWTAFSTTERHEQGRIATVLQRVTQQTN